MLYGGVKQKEKIIVQTSDTMTDFQQRLKEFVQNEHNAALFYSALSMKSKEKEIQNLLKEITAECGKNETAYCNILWSVFHESFKAENRAVDTTMNLKDGIKKAVLIETNELLKERRLYCKLSKNITSVLEDTMYGKMWRLTTLQSIFCSIQ